jgi:site-specific DNA recombinase
MKALLVAQESRAAEIDPLRQKEAALRDRLDEFEQDRTDGLINRDEYFRLRDGVLDRLRVVEVELSALYSSEQAQALLSPITTLREAWGANPMSWRRRLLSLVIERIDVEPDRARPDYYVDGSRYKFNPDSVKITWRH